MGRNIRKQDPKVGRGISADYPLFVVMFLILALGLFMVLDASYARASQPTPMTHGNAYYFLERQALWAFVGILALVWAMNMRYWKLSRYGPFAMILAFVLLLLVWAPGVGVHSHGAARWINLRIIQIQPSEIAKVCCVLFLAGYLPARKLKVQKLEGLLVGVFLPVGLIAALIIKQPDLGTALSLLATCFIMLFVGGAQVKHLLAIAAVGALLLSIYCLARPYTAKRLLGFVDGGAGSTTYAYQVDQSVEALQAGGLHGLGPGQGDAKFFHLPAPYTDFIAATLGEEFGLVGSLTLLGLFFFFTLRGCHIAHRCPNPYGTLLATGLCSMVTVQALLNLAVVTRSLPNTGVPLPMVSFGGSSLMLVLFATGLLLSVSRWPDLKDIDAALESTGRGSSSTSAAAGGRRPTLLKIDTDVHEMARH